MAGDVELLAGRIGRQLGPTQAEEVKRLMLGGAAALGVRPLVRKFGSGVQWNPADDWLVAIGLRMVRGASKSSRCLAKLYEVDAVKLADRIPV